ncbi:hypothetical protein [Salmonella phage PC79-13]|uniref:Uncharacterized protein n=1 Tax=Salmonella phage PC79-13 TaxID=3092642 RepID=A0ABZ0Z5P4_9CAUD|nr:hypothetical protein [Salmonella phage PC79-13]
MKVQKGDVIAICVLHGLATKHDTVYADVTFVSGNGRVYFKPRANMRFLVDRRGKVENGIYAGQVYSTDEFGKGIFTGTWRGILTLGLCTSMKSEEAEEVCEETFEAPVINAEDLPKHDYGAARFTTKLDANGAASVVVDKAQDFFKAFSSSNQHHHHFNPQTKLDSVLTSKCEDAKKLAKEVYEASFTASEVIEENQFEKVIRTMMKAGLTPYQIAEEIQRQFYNAMVNE